MRLVQRFMLLAIMSCLLQFGCSQSAPSGGGPSPALKPEEVVKIVMTAMQHNDVPSKDAGIATAFAFASPGNKKITGPLERFIPMVKSPAYAPMLNFTKIEYADVQLRGDQAQQIVILEGTDGKMVGYVFMLSRQKDGEAKDCWMTDGVMRLREPGAPATRPSPLRPGPPPSSDDAPADEKLPI